MNINEITACIIALYLMGSFVAFSHIPALEVGWNCSAPAGAIGSIMDQGDIVQCLPECPGTQK